MTDKDGFFSLTVSKGSYYCLYAIKLSEWLKTKLEYWTWNVPAYADLEINPQYERMEIYGINAFEPQVGPWDTYMIYFRPMSLTKILDFIQNEDKIKMESLANANHDTTNVAPSTISMDELEVSINEIKAEIKSISRVLEYARGGYLYGYVAQVKKPEDTKVILNNYDKISIVLKSKETGESGKGEYFLEKKNY
ncbi:MAG: hypothetical protein CVT98_10725 [Bacteroidetes bacterium HGW-Bacteroidetes-15]|nr:MAG: hypothetical protein CVT98_10725 [Bacteroidetes bacterium HGW-Bacteroidetes-15]